jgi:hypothetical protein
LIFGKTDRVIEESLPGVELYQRALNKHFLDRSEQPGRATQDIKLSTLNVDLKKDRLLKVLGGEQLIQPPDIDRDLVEF